MIISLLKYALSLIQEYNALFSIILLDNKEKKWIERKKLSDKYYNTANWTCFLSFFSTPFYKVKKSDKLSGDKFYQRSWKPDLQISST